jgi:D-alanyl-D-alanine carboxypeptidase
VLLVIGLVACSSSTTPSRGAAPAGDTPPTFHLSVRRMQRSLDALVSDYNAVGGIAAVSVRGASPTIVVTGTRIDTKAALSASDPFYVASLTKLFVGALVLELVDDHRIDLDATIGSFGVSWRGGDGITVRDLLAHTSGLPPLGGDRGRPDRYSSDMQALVAHDVHHRFTGEEIIAATHDRQLESRPGTTTSYSNLDTIVLGVIVEHVLHEPLVQALHERILDPLHLSSTRYVAAEPPPRGTIAIEPGSDVTSFVSAIGAGGAIVSTAADLVTFANAFLRDGSLLSDASQRLATTITAGGTGLGTLGFGGFHRHDSFCIFLDTGCRPGTVFSGVGGSGSFPNVRDLLVYDHTSDTTVLVFVEHQDVPVEFLAHAIWFGQTLT